jgi:hypothetical protein
MAYTNETDAYTGTIGKCKVCGGEFEKVPANKTVCSPACRRRVVADNALKYYHRQGADQRREQKAERKEWEDSQEFDPAFLSDNPAYNLISAVAYQAHVDGDEEARDDLLDLIGGMNA